MPQPFSSPSPLPGTTMFVAAAARPSNLPQNYAHLHLIFIFAIGNCVHTHTHTRTQYQPHAHTLVHLPWRASQDGYSMAFLPPPMPLSKPVTAGTGAQLLRERTCEIFMGQHKFYKRSCPPPSPQTDRLLVPFHRFFSEVRHFMVSLSLPPQGCD